MDDIKYIYRLIKSKKLLIFDFDGVIVDSIEIKTNAFAQLYHEFGMKVVEKVINHHYQNGGMSRFEKFKYYHHNFLGREIDKNEVCQLSIKFSDLVVNDVVNSHEIQGVDEFLKLFCTGDKLCVINSATPKGEMKKIIELRHQTKYFSKIYGSPSSKFNNLMNALEFYNAHPKDTIFFGDALADLNASKDAGIDFIAVGNKKIFKGKHDLNFISDFSKFL
jgi:phosphoglycolate phosphatase-like HAD superfamily hydrolase